jgi:hypothetical protein
MRPTPLFLGNHRKFQKETPSCRAKYTGGSTGIMPGSLFQNINGFETGSVYTQRAWWSTRLVFVHVKVKFSVDLKAGYFDLNKLALPVT